MFGRLFDWLRSLMQSFLTGPRAASDDRHGGHRNQNASSDFLSDKRYVVPPHRIGPLPNSAALGETFRLIGHSASERKQGLHLLGASDFHDSPACIFPQIDVLHLVAIAVDVLHAKLRLGVARTICDADRDSLKCGVLRFEIRGEVGFDVLLHDLKKNIEPDFAAYLKSQNA